MTRRVALLLTLVLIVPCRAKAQDEEPKDLAGLLAAYDKAGGGDTIPIEQAFIKLKDARAGKELLPHLSHHRFGFIAAWVASEIGDPSLAGPVLEAFKKCETRGKVAMAPYLATFPTGDVRAALKDLLEKGQLGSDAEKSAVRSALLRAKDAPLEKETLERVRGKDAAACAAALLALGDARRADLLGEISALARDARKPEPPLKSCFGVVTTTKTENGSSSRTDYPELTTIADVALEAASRCVRSTTPEMIAWWYEHESLPRFSRGEDGAKLLSSYVAGATKASKAKLCGPGEALAAVLRHLGKTAGGGLFSVKLLGLELSDRWQVRFQVVEDGKAEPERTIAVDGKGTVIAR